MAYYMSTNWHTSATQLVQCIGVLKEGWLVEGVGLDTADVVWLHCLQLVHQLSQLLLELAANTVELEALEPLAALSISSCRQSTDNFSVGSPNPSPNAFQQ